VIKLKRDISISYIEDLISNYNEWIQMVPNSKEETIEKLTPVSVAGSLAISVGRLRKLPFGPKYLGAFTIGDQLLWGAAEPLRRILKYLS
jgi:aspartate-semialdehyde dehydrogenase